MSFGILILRLGRGSASQTIRIHADSESQNSTLTLTLPWFRCSFNNFYIRVKTLSTIGGIPLSLPIARYDVFWVGVVSALLVSHSRRDARVRVVNQRRKKVYK